MPTKKQTIDDLFAERDIRQTPDEVIEAIKEIIRRNDKIGIHSNRRVSFSRCITWIREVFNYQITRSELDRVVKNLNRRSWGRV